MLIRSITPQTENHEDLNFSYFYVFVYVFVYIFEFKLFYRNVCNI